MKIAFVGMGKLGFPCALAAAARGHDVVGYDTSAAAAAILASRRYPHREEGAQALLEATTLRMVESVEDVVSHAELVFVAVQTPHRPEFEGLTRMPAERADFDYSALVLSIRAIAHEALVQKKPVAVVVISTCLPGTCRREIYPLLNQYTGFVYNPFFIAMGTTIADYLKPEFVLLGHDKVVDRVDSLDRVQKFYRELHDPNAAAVPVSHTVPHEVMSVTSAELCKVAYNVFLGLKIVAANSVMEIAHRLGANCDDVTNALGRATDRVVSAKYMRGGMGDGGGCHPRDQIALAWLAAELNLSYDLFGTMVLARECQTEFVASLVEEEAIRTGLPIVILGKAYKRGTNLTLGSPAILLKNILDGWGVASMQWDPHVDDKGYRWHDNYPFEERPSDVDGKPTYTMQPAVHVIATDHDEFRNIAFADGSVVIDPWGKMPDRHDAKVIRVGRTPRAA